MAESISQYPMVDKFLRYLQVEKNTSPLTVKNYAADISLFSNFSRTAGERFSMAEDRSFGYSCLFSAAQ